MESSLTKLADDLATIARDLYEARQVVQAVLDDVVYKGDVAEISVNKFRDLEYLLGQRKKSSNGV